MNSWSDIIKKIAPKAKTSIINGLADAMPDIIKIANLSTPLRQAHFLAQLAHESAGFTTTEEFASGSAYEGRKDLGNIYKGDGVKYKGRGLIQLTGRSNYKTLGDQLGVDFVDDPKLAGQFPYAALTAALFWKNKKLNSYADKDNIKEITRRINGGYNGLADRERYLERAKSALNDIAWAQDRLKSLNYALGSTDGKIGPLTKSAIRDFQDDNDLEVNGQLDEPTKNLLMSDDANPRPVSDDRKNITAKDLRESGSEIADGTYRAKVGIASAGIATAANIASEAKDMAAQAQEIVEGVKSGAGIVEIIKDYWFVILAIVSAFIILFCLYRAYKAAQKAELARVNNARNGSNVRV